MSRLYITFNYFENCNALQLITIIHYHYPISVYGYCWSVLLALYGYVTAGLFLCSYIVMLFWSVSLLLYMYVISLLVCFFEVTCVWLYYCWSFPLKLHVYGYIAAGLFL